MVSCHSYTDVCPYCCCHVYGCTVEAWAFSSSNTITSQQGAGERKTDKVINNHVSRWYVLDAAFYVPDRPKVALAVVYAAAVTLFGTPPTFEREIAWK